MGGKEYCKGKKMLNVSKLKNGMRVITDTDQNSDVVTLGVWVCVGARYETPDMNGISHVLEHMAFKGTTTRSARQISEEIENVGGLINAYTGKNVTAYHVKVLKENMALGLDIIADILQNSIMDETELEREKGVICQEINMNNDDPEEVASDYFFETAFPNQALGRPIIGTAELVRSVTSKQLRDYMHSQYTADRMIISASGNFDEQEFIKACEKAFAGITSHETKPADKAHYVGGDKCVQKDTEQVNVFLGFEGITYGDPDYYAAKVLSGVLGGGMSSRLFQEVREKRGLVYTIYAFSASEKDTGVFGIYAGTGEKETAELMPAVCDEIIKIQNGVTADELNRAKNRYKAALLMQGEAISSHAEANAIDMVIYGRVVPKQEVIAAVDAVTNADVIRVAKRIFATKPTLAALGPIKHLMSYQDVENRLKNA